MSREREERAASVLRRVDPAWESEQVERSFGGLAGRRRRQNLRRVALATTGVAAIGGVIAFFVSRVPETALGEVAGSPVEEIEPPHAIIATAPPTRLADGSTLTPRDLETRVVVREVSDTLIRVGLEAGEVDVAVTPRPERSFVIESGAIRVVVLGTRFTVERLADDRSEVRVDHGRVRVEWDGGDETLTDGQAGAFPPVISEVADDPEDPPAPRVERPRRDWRVAAREGGYEEAYALIERGGARAVEDEVGDLLLAADAARLSGHGAEALPYLERIASGHASDDRAPMAEFTRGRVLLSLSRAAQAGAAFEHAMELGAEGSLHENALARAVEAHGRAGESARAEALARQYVARYPRGRWESSVRAYGGLDE